MDDKQQEMAARQKLVFYLMDKGLSNEEVARTMADVAEAALEEFTQEAMALFNDEDKKAIEAATSGIEADDLVKDLYEEKSGNEADDRIEELIDAHAVSYMSDSHNTEIDSATSASGVSQ